MLEKNKLTLSLQNYFENLSLAPTIWLAFSGGLDSTVLLHLIKQQLNSKKIFVVHINHGLSPNAKKWEQHCTELCKKWDFNYQCIRVNAKPEPGMSPEAAARNARYQAFADLIQQDDYLLTAHHQDDQIETLFLQLFRGAGVKGLAAMPVIKKFQQGFLLRPLLNYSRVELETYAKKNNLTWIDDESNFDTAYDRNYIRKELLPVIKKRWSSVGVTLSRVTKHCAAAAELLDDLAEIDFANCYNAKNKTLQISQLKLLSEQRQYNLLRYWLQKLNLPLPNKIKLDEIFKSLLAANEDANPLVHWADVEIRRYRDEIYAMPPLSSHDSKLVISWDLKSDLILPNNLGIVRIVDVKELTIPENVIVTIRFRQGGEKIKLSKRGGHHELKNLFQEGGIPPWLRDRVPLVYVGEELVWVAFLIS